MGTWHGVLKRRAITIAAAASSDSKQSESFGVRFAGVVV
jgi:hypothetical protein